MDDCKGRTFRFERSARQFKPGPLIRLGFFEQISDAQCGCNFLDISVQANGAIIATVTSGPTLWSSRKPDDTSLELVRLGAASPSRCCGSLSRFRTYQFSSVSRHGFGHPAPPVPGATGERSPLSPVGIGPQVMLTLSLIVWLMCAPAAAVLAGYCVLNER